jgi:hypothetical protein
MISKMKLSIWAEACKPLLSDANFHSLKPHFFGRRIGGIVQFVSFQGQKKDIYIWYSALPVSLPGLWPSAGCQRACGRLPHKSGMLTLMDDSRLPKVTEELYLLLESQVLPHLFQLSKLEQLTEAMDESLTPYGAFPKAFCYFEQRRFPDGREVLERFCKDPRLFKDPSLPTLEPQRTEAVRYLNYSDEALQTALEQEAQLNIAKNRLSKLNVQKSL